MIAIRVYGVYSFSDLPSLQVRVDAAVGEPVLVAKDAQLALGRLFLDVELFPQRCLELLKYEGILIENIGIQIK